VTIVRPRHPFDGQALQVLGWSHRKGQLLLLLVLPDGDKYEYLCAYCSHSLGTKMEYEEREIKILI
jgi:hypothetical protein